MTATAPRTTPRTRWARAVTEVSSPVHVVAVLLVVMGVHGTPDRLAGLVQGLVAAVFVAVLPQAAVLAGVRRGTWTDKHVTRREQRAVPMAIGLVSLVAGLLVLRAIGASSELVALLVAMAAGLVTAGAITAVWKISVHGATTAGAATVLVVALGPVALAGFLLVALAGWSRVVLREHTPAQVVAGAALGAAVAGTVFTALR